MKAPRSLVVKQLAQQSVTRLRLACKGFIAMFLLSEVLVQASLRLGHEPTLLPLYCNALGLALSILCLGLLAKTSFSLDKQVLVGEIYLVSLAFIMSLGEASEGFQGNQHGLSRLVLVVLLIPIVLPCGPRRALTIAALSILTQPLAYWILGHWGFPSWSTEQGLVLFLGDLLAIGAATLPSRAVAELNQKALESYELGQYRLNRLLSEGGMGEVWLAEHKMLQLPAAIKLLKVGTHSLQEETEKLTRFRMEARALAELKNPHTVRVLDFGEDASGTLYLAMELLEGIDLDRLVRRYGAVPFERVLVILIQACQSLQEAHKKQFIHRDIKPANLFLTLSPSLGDCIKVLDFGLVSLRTSQPQAITSPNIVMGTPEYMAPEISRGEPARAGSDLYSLGCLAFWLLTGQEVFPRKSPLETMIAHQHAHPPRPSWRIEQEIPRELDLLVEKCLHKKPEGRPQSALELMTQLQSIPCSQPWNSECAQSWWEIHLSSELPGP